MPRTLLAVFATALLLLAHPTLAGYCGIYTAPDGVDGPACGLEPGSPCATIDYALDRAVTEGLGCVFLRAGEYAGPSTVPAGQFQIRGGFDANWQEGPPGDFAYRALVQAASNDLDATIVVGASTSLALVDLELRGPVKSGVTPQGHGQNSVAILVEGGTLDLQGATVVAAPAYHGLNGAHGQPSSMPLATISMLGGTGGNADAYSTLCDNSSRGVGGAAGTSPNGSSGGDGGNGGTMDSVCSFPQNFSATAGAAGQSAPNSSGSYGSGGAGGAPCLSPADGRGGRVSDGPGGPGAGSPGSFVGGNWVPNGGTSGALGQHGTGGGGGGGSGGCDTGTDSYGAGGGGGGAGGDRATAPGRGGGGGGSSFGVFAVGGSVRAEGCVFLRGAGGNGGAGGDGGYGQEGGRGGAGGLADDDSQAGGDGGDGARGGHSGAGGGGAGGMSCAIYMQQGELAQLGNSFVGGTGGAGGPAGNDPQPANPAHAYAASSATAGVGGGVYSVLENSPQPVGAPPQLAECSPQACEAVGAPGQELVLSFRGAEPNPVAGRASFAFETPRPAAVQLRIFDARGRLVVETREREFGAGAHVLPLEAGALAAGVYRAQLRVGAELRVRAFSVLR